MTKTRVVHQGCGAPLQRRPTMKLLGVIRLAHRIIAGSLNFFLVNALILAGLVALGFGLLYFALAAAPAIIIFLLYPLVALLFYMYAAAAQVQYYGPRVRGEEPLPSPRGAWNQAREQWLPLALMAVILTAVAMLLFLFPEGVNALYGKLAPLKAPLILSFDQLKQVPLAQITQIRNFITLIFYLIFFLVTFLLLPLFALGFTIAYRRGEGVKTAIKKLWSFYKTKPCSSTLLYFFGLVVMILFPCRLLSLTGLPGYLLADVIFIGLQALIALLVAVYGILITLVSQMILWGMVEEIKAPG